MSTPPATAPSTPPQPAASADAKAGGYSRDTQAEAQREISSPAASTPGLRAWTGLTVTAIQFRGVPASALDPLPSRLELQAGQKLDPKNARESLRRLYSTGLYRNIEVEGVRNGDQVTIIFAGTPRLFLGTVTVTGIKNDRLVSQLVRATKLYPGTPFSDAKLEQADTLLKETLQENGYYQPKVTRSTNDDTPNLQANIEYHIELGKQARVGNVAVTGDSGLPLPTFRKTAKLKAGSKVNRDTVNRALTNLRKTYQKRDRLEANVALEEKKFEPPVNHLDYNFNAEQGPVVEVHVTGAGLSRSATKRLIPVYEEGAVDEDLLNEGNRNLRDHYQRQGYFDVRVRHEEKQVDSRQSLIDFFVTLGPSHRVLSVTVEGNKYFDRDTLEDRLTVRKAGTFDRHGLYSQALVNADVNSISALYQSNGFTHVKVTPKVNDTDETPEGKDAKVADLRVKYVIDEGVQQKIGSMQITGTDKVPLGTLTPLLNTQPGQPYSALNINGDRDVILGYYLSHGFDHVQLEVFQKDDAKDPSLINVTMKVTEGDQTFVNQVLVSGLHYTRPETIHDSILVHSGEPLNQTALLETQRRLYDLTLFNEVNSAVQNPNGDEPRKNVLLQFTEARRWDINYGFGFEAQTGNPQDNCLSAEQLALLTQLGFNTRGYSCTPNGRFGVSPRVLFDISRINLRGRDQSITLRTTYGTLERRAQLIFQYPHLLGNPHFDLSFSAGYVNSQDVTTYAASRTEGSMRVTEHAKRPNTLIYEFAYRLVQINSNTLQVAPNLIPLFSQPARIGGPGVTWLRDTRDNPLDAHHGTYISAQEFLAHGSFGSQSNFSRLDITNSSYHGFGKKKDYVLARSTRFGYERAFGSGGEEFIPLPERLYAGGAQSHRGFPINAAGPRDPQTGFPVGGAGAFVNSLEERLPNPNLPYVGNGLGFVLFHDMGNVFTHSSEIWPSFSRLSQPNRNACKNLTPSATGSGATSATCGFNYFSHAVGVGLRYHTPIGPVRGDFSYNLNPPIYPVIYDYNGGPPHVGQADHFNFFFSIGQSF
jgi:outer membrane protein insertion porin family